MRGEGEARELCVPLSFFLPFLSSLLPFSLPFFLSLFISLFLPSFLSFSLAFSLSFSLSFFSLPFFLPLFPSPSHKARNTYLLALGRPFPRHNLCSPKQMCHSTSRGCTFCTRCHPRSACDCCRDRSPRGSLRTGWSSLERSRSGHTAFPPGRLCTSSGLSRLQTYDSHTACTACCFRETSRC